MSILSDSVIFDVTAILTTLLVGIVAYCKWKLTYWDRVGLPTLPTTIPFGNTKDLLLGRKTFGEQYRDLYREFKRKGFTKHGGVYLGISPHYLVIDPEMVKNVMQKDFVHFMNHGNFVNEERDPLAAHLFNLKDAKWKNMRVKLTPTFTSGKMKMMFQTLADCSVGLQDIMNVSASNHTAVDIKDTLARFTTDIIGSVAFGLECNSIKDPETPFRKFGRRVFETDAIQRLKIVAQFALPHNVLRAMNFKFTRPDVEAFFKKVVRDNVDYREKNNIYRKDFMHLLLQLKNRGTVTDDDKITDENGKTQEKALTMDEVTAQAFVFFVAGFETSSTLMTFTLFELARNPDIQDKLREEINTVLKKHGDQLTYDAVMEMTYMEKVLHESLRKYPPVAFLSRKCTKDYTIPNTSIVIKKGITVAIPALGLHSDPEYYPNPDKFDPERFSEENKNSRPSFTWLPFGEGPRLCIGLRFGMLQSRVGLSVLLKNYRIKLSNKTKLPLTFDKRAVITTAKDGIWLDVEKI